MAGKLVEINPDISLRPEEITATVMSTDRSRLIVHTRHHGAVEVNPLQGETLEVARRRLSAAVNAQGDDAAQLIRLGPDLYMNPAAITTVGRNGEYVRIGITGADYVSFFHEDPAAAAEDIAARVNAVMRERRLGLNAI